MSFAKSKNSKMQESKAGSLVGSFVESQNPMFEETKKTERVIDVEGYIDLERTKFHVGKFKVSEKNYLLFLFTLINFFLFADQNLLAPNLSVIAEQFNMTDDERDRYLGGYISLGFFVVGGIIAMIVGYMADTLDRKAVFAATVCVGELSCMITYWVPVGSISDFWSGLWLTRAITGVSLGGALPIQYSLLGDIFTEEERGVAVGLIAVAYNLGFTGGQYLANLMSPDFRTPFLIVSIPTFFLVALFCVSTPEPKRGQAEKLIQGREEKLNGDHKISWSKVKVLLNTPSAILVIIQGLPGTLPWGVVGVFVNDFLLEEKNKSSLEAGNIMLIFGLFSAAATIFGGKCVDLFIESRPEWLPFIAGITTFIAPSSFLIIFVAPELSAVWYALFMIPGGFIIGIAGPVVKGILLHVTLPETRGTAFALQSLMDELGKGLGPFIISAIIGFVPDRKTGLIIGILGWVPSSLLMMLIARYIRDDQRRYREALAEAYDLQLSQAELEGEPHQPLQEEEL